MCSWIQKKIASSLEKTMLFCMRSRHSSCRQWRFSSCAGRAAPTLRKIRTMLAQRGDVGVVFLFCFAKRTIAFQDLEHYVRPIEELGGTCVYGPPNETESWQPIDAGHLGAMIKAKAKEYLEIWMHKE